MQQVIDWSPVLKLALVKDDDKGYNYQPMETTPDLCDPAPTLWFLRQYHYIANHEPGGLIASPPRIPTAPAEWQRWAKQTGLTSPVAEVDLEGSRG